jgi:hypothetical protein
MICTSGAREEGTAMTLMVGAVTSGPDDSGMVVLTPDEPTLHLNIMPADAGRLRSMVEDLYELRSRLAHGHSQPVSLVFSSDTLCEYVQAALDATLPPEPPPPEEYSAPDVWLAAAAYDSLRAWRSPGLPAGVARFGYLGPDDSAITLTPDPKAAEVVPIYSYFALLPTWPEPDDRKALGRFVGGIIAALSMLLVRVLAALSRMFNAVNSVLVMIAACLRYGHRQEPDDHHSLPARRYQSWPGRAPAV